MKTINLIWTNPGSDSKKEMNISFHSNSEKALLLYSNDNFITTKNIESTGVFTPKPYKGNDNYYHHSVCLSDLQPNTSYSYKIKVDNYISETYKFKCCGDDCSFSFSLIGDIHTIPGEELKIKRVDNLIAKSKELANGIDFILSYGDMVLNGEDYSHWEVWNKSKELKNYMIAPIPGNKEYYNMNGDRTTNLWFTSMYNCPKNGVQGLESTYYFIYNNVLFIGLDCISHEGSEMKGDYCQLESQQKWFSKVMEETKGMYAYSIVFRHYPFFSTKEANTEKAYKSWGKYPEWYPLFDKYNIDLVLTGDNHAYATSKRLYNNEISNDFTKGTIYVTAPEIPLDVFETKLEDATNSFMLKHQRGATAGNMFATVTKDNITLNLVGYNEREELNIYDVIIIPRRNREII